MAARAAQLTREEAEAIVTGVLTVPASTVSRAEERLAQFDEARRVVNLGPKVEPEELPDSDARWVAACKTLGIYPGDVPFTSDKFYRWEPNPHYNPKVEMGTGNSPQIRVTEARTLEQEQYRQTGSLLHYPGDWQTCVDWRPNYIFEATLRFQGYARGRSAAYLWMMTEGGVEYPMFLTFFDKLITRTDVYRGWVHGEWTFAKRGENYSLAWYGYKSPPWEVKRLMRTEKCFLDTCEKTSEVDEGTDMALEPGWLSEGRGDGRRFFCGMADRVMYLRGQNERAIAGSATYEPKSRGGTNHGKQG